MNQRFSLQRIQWLLVKDWIEHKKSIFYALGTFLVALVPFIWISTHTGGMNLINKQIAFYVLGLLGSFLYFCKYAGREVHYPKGLYWTLPASTEEKYVALLLEGVLFLFSFVLLFWLSVGLWGLIFPDYQMVRWEMIYTPSHGIAFGGFMASLLFYFYIRFKKHAFAIWLITLVVVAGCLLGIVYLCVRYLHEELRAVADYVANCEWPVSVFRFIGVHIHLVWVLLMAAVLYAAYLTFKRKELR